jgi:hypothetical protein
VPDAEVNVPLLIEYSQRALVHTLIRTDAGASIPDTTMPSDVTMVFNATPDWSVKLKGSGVVSGIAGHASSQQS